MRAPVRAAALALSALALTVPAAVLTSMGVSAAEVGPGSGALCSPQSPCGDPAEPGPSVGPTPTESPTESPTPGPTESPTEAPEPTESPPPTESPEPVEATEDDDAPIFAKTPASLGSEKLVHGAERRLDRLGAHRGRGSIRALKITADSITITGFSLTVRPPGEPGLVTKADEMTLKGDVSVYIGSITATTKDGKSLTIGTDTPPPLDDVEPGLVRVTMGLVGSMADSISYSNTDQKIVKP
ncbi:hypothetical protein IOD13_17475 [Brevibacterium casei]|nr:hypothetical protein [Brevibacterium casei]